MAETVRFLLRMRQDLYEALQRIAEREHRSINGQIVYVLERFVEETQQQEPGEGKAAA